MINKLTKFHKEASFGATVALILAIAVVVNVLSYELFVRFDLTKNKDYSISATSKQTVANLDDVVNVKAYFSQNAPNQYAQVRQEVTDLMDEYVSYSKGKVRFEMIDPGTDSEMQQQLRSQGIPQVQFNVMEKDKYQVLNGYMGMVISYGDKTEVLPVVQSTQSFEYEMTSKIKKLTAKEPTILGVVTSNKTLDQATEIKNVVGALKNIYDLQDVDLTKVKEVPANIKTLLIFGPKEKFSDSELKTIDAFVMSGGSVFVAADGVGVQGNLQAVPTDTGLNKLLEKYGLKINTDLVLDSSAGIASFNQGFVTFNLQYPFWPKIQKDGFDQNNSAVSSLETVTFPWASSIQIDKSKISKDANVVELVRTSNKSWLQSSGFNLNPQQDFKPTEFGQYPLAVMLTGEIKSAFEGKSTKQGRIVVVSDSDFLRDGFSQGQGDNLNLVSNLTDSLSLGTDLMSIRAKGVTTHPIKDDISDGEKASMRYGNVFGITILVLAYGMYRYTSRRKKYVA